MLCDRQNQVSLFCGLDIETDNDALRTAIDKIGRGHYTEDEEIIYEDKDRKFGLSGSDEG
jgi:hypothetical protein